MACTRRSLTSTFSLLSRRLHPSLSHISGNRRQPPPPPTPSPAPSFSPRFDSRSSLGFAPHRFYSSSSDITDADIMTDVADAVVTSDPSFAAAVSTVPMPFPGEVAAAAADSYLPVAALQYLIDGVQSFTGLHWWAAIAVTTVLIRGATIPLLLNQMRTTMKLNMMRPELEELKQDMKNSRDPESMIEGNMRMKALFKKHGITPFAPLKGLFIQGPIFISFFLAIQNMVEKVPSFKAGGTLWFTDLTTPDPMYVLPVLTSLTFLATVELNMQEGMEGNPMVNNMKIYSRALALFTIPFTAHFPKAIFFYWITSNICSLLFGFVLRRPPVRAYLNLPDLSLQPPSTTPPPPDFSFFGGSKPIEPTSPTSDNELDPVTFRVRRSSVISQRIRNLEKSVKARSKPRAKSEKQ